MPEMDGMEATRQICDKWDPAERPRIIAMTASAMQGDRERCLEAGMDDYVSKPVLVEELQAALERNTQSLPTSTVRDLRSSGFHTSMIERMLQKLLDKQDRRGTSVSMPQDTLVAATAATSTN